MGALSRVIHRHRFNLIRCYCRKTCKDHECRLLIVGGGTGGCSVAWRFAKRLKKDISVLEPSQVHYNQPYFALVAAGIKQYKNSWRSMQAVLPPQVTWVRGHADHFDPHNNVILTRCGHRIFYEYMVVAVGLQNNYDEIPGLKQALDDPYSSVSTIYSPEYCLKTWCNIRHFQGGHAVFTFPQIGGKCSGAAQKIMYLADDFWRKNKLRDLTNITYNTGGDAIFGIPKYAASLHKIVADRNIVINCCTQLIEVHKKEAVFMTKSGETITFPYNLLHVMPPMGPPPCLAKCQELVDERGYLDVDKHSLQHRRFPNIYGIGDCINTPNSKTAAAVAVQNGVVHTNLFNTMAGKEPSAKYNGYGACPMLTSYKKGILAEFLYDKKIWESFPFDQSKERRIFLYLKRDVLPYIYWNMLLKGKWNGPETLRKIMRPFG